MLPENEDSKRVVNETPARTGNYRGRGNMIRMDAGPADADLPESDDEDPDADAEDDTESSGALWDDPNFPTPSSIKLPASTGTVTGIEWMRPPVSNSCLV